MRHVRNVAPPEVLEKFQNRLPHAVQLTVYGGTEGGCVTMTRVDDPLEARLNTCGACQPGLELRIVDLDAATQLGAGRARRDPVPRLQHARGYWNDTREDRRDDPRGRLGDDAATSACSTRDGRVLFLGRVKETLKVGGENVAPQEIEAQLSHAPGGQARAGRRHPRRAAARGGRRRSSSCSRAAEATEEELIDHCQRPDRLLQGAARSSASSARTSGRCRRPRSSASGCASNRPARAASSEAPKSRRRRAEGLTPRARL